MISFEQIDAAFEAWWARRAMKGKLRVKLYQRLARLLKNRQPVPMALETLWEGASLNGRKPRRNAAVIVDAWRQVIREGRNQAALGAAMGGWIPVIEQAIIQAGEGPNQHLAIRDAIDLIRGMKKIRAALRKAIAFPAMLLVVGIGLLLMFSYVVVPLMSYTLPPETMTGFAYSLAWTSGALRAYLIPIAVLAVLFLIMVRWSLPNLTGRPRMLLERLPPWSYYRLLEGVAFLLAFAALLKGGKNELEACRALRLHATPYLQERLDPVIEQLIAGKDMGFALNVSIYRFPDDEIISDIATYSKTEGLSEAVDMVARDWFEEGVELVEERANRINEIATALMFLLILWFGGSVIDMGLQTAMRAFNGNITF